MAKTHDGFEVYEASERSMRDGSRRRWYWRLRRKGRIVADGAEDYTRKGDCVRAVTGVRRYLESSVVPIIVLERDKKR
jgi:uncharacterized protein YegP (UPF0339 family)